MPENFKTVDNGYIGDTVRMNIIRAKFWPDCAIPDTSMKFGTVVGHDRLSRKGYRTTLGNAYCACAKHFLILGCYHRAFIQFDFKEGVMLAAE